MGGGDAGVEVSVDVLVVGGGVCGLWTLHALRAAGYDAWLIEKSALGDGQTIASQGILHAGAKYKLPGNAVDAARAVADVQGVWEDAMVNCDADPMTPMLNGVRIIDERTLLWTTPGLGSRLAAKGAKKIMRSAVTSVARDRWPAGFAGAPKGVDVFETAEMVLDPGSLLERLAEGRFAAGRSRIGRVASIADGPGGVHVRLEGVDCAVRASAVVLAAGEGNEALLELSGADGASLMQRRPLHQLVAVGAPFDLNGHCLQMSVDKPALTVTTGELDGRRTWYFGGGPAEEGVGRTPADQIAAGKAAVARCLPWVDQSSFDWRVFAIDRAEGRQAGGKRPSEAVVVWTGERVMAAWPTKLVLAPRAAGLVLERLRERAIWPSGTDGAGGAIEETSLGALASLPVPAVAERVW